MNTEEFALSALEDRIFSLELALTNIGGALLAPGSWEDDQRLHQYMYDTVRRALLRTGFGDALDQRERQLVVRDAVPVVHEPAHRTEPIASPAAAPAAPAAPADAPDAVSALGPEALPDPAPSGTTLVASDASLDGPRDYGWPTQP
jgi:hypothetical protein